MDGFSLKVLACILMLIDHIGAVFFPKVLLIRVIGRLSFPIFAFLIAEGYFRTKNLKRYIFRLIILAIISQIPFMLAFDTKGLNIFFTLFAGIFAMMVLDKKFIVDFEIYNKKISKNIENVLNILFKIILFSLIFYLVEKLNTDYAIYGVCMILCFKIWRDKFMKLTIALIILNAIYAISLFKYLITPYGTLNIRVFLQATSIFSLFFIHKYNNMEGKKIQKLFYAFYPVHLSVLILIGKFLGN
ncbi:MAG: TraX family protein [Clostridium sp.]|uniref:TraX family protein n=1 Tax=Clostridium sp. TaxID=1506 RepID=UPI00307186C6